jgi:hypothetical protein
MTKELRNAFARALRAANPKQKTRKQLRAEAFDQGRIPRPVRPHEIEDEAKVCEAARIVLAAGPHPPSRRQMTHWLKVQEAARLVLAASARERAATRMARWRAKQAKIRSMAISAGLLPRTQHEAELENACNTMQEILLKGATLQGVEYSRPSQADEEPVWDDEPPTS